MNFKLILLAGFIVLTIIMGYFMSVSYYTPSAIKNVDYEIHLIADLNSIQKTLEITIMSAISTSELSELKILEEKVLAEHQKFNERFKDLSETKMINQYILNKIKYNHEIFIDTSEQIIELQKTKLNNQRIFTINYDLEKDQRYEIRTPIFELQDYELAKEIGDIQYYSKEALYQQKDQKYLDYWLDSITNFKEDITNSELFTENEKINMIQIIDDYNITANKMGVIVIEEKKTTEIQNSKISEINIINQEIDDFGNELIEFSKIRMENTLIDTGNNILIVGILGLSILIIVGIVFFKKFIILEKLNKKQLKTITSHVKNIQSQNRVMETLNEEVLKQNNKLKESDKLKLEFSSMISHELKTPLSPIFNWCKLLSKGMLGNVNEKQIHALSKIDSNAQKLLSLIQDILDVHKLELGKVSFNISKFEVKELLTEIMEDYKIDHSDKCSFSVESEEVVCNSDNSRITQVIKNLINNSLDFLPSTDPKITLSAKNDNEHVIFSVKDNGCGIPENKQEHLFKKFYQIDTSAKRKHGGTGLGLSICKGIVEGLGGTIGIKSKVGKGSEFFIKLPKELIIKSIA